MSHRRVPRFHRWLPVLCALVVVMPAARSLADGGERDAGAWSGVVRVDGNANGVAETDEPGLAGVAVSNGREVVRTDASGRYRIAARPGEFVQLTCPSSHVCEVWYRPEAGDFAVRPVPEASDFFFVQISDAHVYSDPEDFARFSSPPAPWWMPQALADWLALYFIGRGYPELTREELIASLAAALPPDPDRGELSDREVYRAYSEAIGRREIAFARAEERFRAALEEVRSLGPSFVISTGDLWLEGNRGTPEAIESWRALYSDATGETGLQFYNTIGNNEVAGTENDEFPPSDARYGKHYFRETYGPTAYSFDRGPFHFVVFDTHVDESDEDGEEAWDFYRMPEEVQRWAEADLSAHTDRVLVALNHEPFHYEPAWDFDDPRVTDDAGLFERFGVRYSIAGHTHKNGFEESATGTTHITTGALSGMRWVLPPDVHPRGYRLFYAKDGELYSAWKETGRPLIGFVAPTDPESPPDYHPASRGAQPPTGVSGVLRMVVVAADIDGAMTDLSVDLDGEAVPVERWGRYFAAADLDTAGLPEKGGVLRVRAKRRDGGTASSSLRITPAR